MDIRSLITKPPTLATVPPRHAARRRLRLRLSGAAVAAGANGSGGRQPIRSRPSRRMFPARAKRVIFLFMHGGPSSIDTFDPKPTSIANNGKPLPIKQPLPSRPARPAG